MTMSVQSPGRSLSFRGSRGRRGFSLVELLVVIFILGILFVAGGREISHAWKAQKLQSASTDIKVFMQRALPEMERRCALNVITGLQGCGMVTFIQIGPLQTVGAVRYLPIYLIGDANQNGTLDSFANPPTAGSPDLLIDEYDIIVVGQTGIKGSTGVGQEFSLSVQNVSEVMSSRWLTPTVSCATPTDSPFCDSKLWTAPRALMCDFQGRAIDTTTGLQLAGPATLVLTHVDVVNQAYAPPTRFLLSINPVWSVRVQKQIRDATGTWVDQQGG